MSGILTKFGTACACAGLLLSQVAPSSHAEIYKWVDAKGQTHYSDNKDEAGQTPVAELKVKPAAAPVAPPSMPVWQQQELEFKRRQAQLPLQTPSRPKPPEKNYYRSGRLETDANRCELARDIKSGVARHSNGAPVDTNDRQVAESDIRNFCH